MMDEAALDDVMVLDKWLEHGAAVWISGLDVAHADLTSTVTVHLGVVADGAPRRAEIACAGAERWQLTDEPPSGRRSTRIIQRWYR
jgi:hypothetical protein